MESSKTTFYLSNDLRARLKTLGARQGKSIKQLLTEGAELVLSRYRAVEDREELRRRSAIARERLRRGLYAGPAVAEPDDIVYPHRKRRKQN